MTGSVFSGSKHESAIIVLEGIDASGKATQARLLHEHMLGNGMCAQLISFPDYSSPTGKLIKAELQLDRPRLSPLEFQALMTMNRMEKVPQIRAGLESGTIFVFDRYWLSGVAYGAADGLDKQYLIDAHAALPQADLTVFLDITPEESMRRRPERRDAYEKRPGFLYTVRQNYQELFDEWLLPLGHRRDRLPDAAVARLCADSAGLCTDAYSIEFMHRRILDAVLRMLINRPLKLVR